MNLALSGGIDSSVSALLLLERGWEVQPYTMRCWDDSEWPQETSCWEREFRAARAAAKHLSLSPPIEVDLVADYWTRVFEPFLHGVRDGYMGNADLACNREIKFGVFAERVSGMIGTGHYARVEDGVLKSGVDEGKDQSYFLASVGGDIWDRVVCPVGVLRKDEVREIGRHYGMPALAERSSRGMCFVGKRSMGDFLARYVEGAEGRFVDVMGQTIGSLKGGGVGYTIGQRARVSGLSEAVYVVGRKGFDVIVATESDARLFSKGVFCEHVDWMREEVEGRVVVKTCSTAKKMGARVKKTDEGWVVIFDREVRRVAQGQAVVLYDEEDVVLGASWPVENARAAEVLGRYVRVEWKDVVAESELGAQDVKNERVLAGAFVSE